MEMICAGLDVVAFLPSKKPNARMRCPTATGAIRDRQANVVSDVWARLSQPSTYFHSRRPASRILIRRYSGGLHVDVITLIAASHTPPPTPYGGSGAMIFIGLS